MSYRARILGIVALVTFPLLALAGLAFWQDMRATEVRVREERIALASAIALTADAFVEGQLGVLQSLAHVPMVTDLDDPAAVLALFAREQQLNPIWETLALAGADGWNLASPGVPPRTVNLSDRLYFQRVLATGQPYVSSALISKSTNRPVVALAVPVETSTGGRNVLVVHLSVERLAEKLRAVSPEQRAQIVVVDEQGQAFIHFDPAIASALTSLRGRADVEAVLAGERGSWLLADVGADEMLAAFAPMTNARWGVLLLQAASAAFEPVRSSLLIASGLFAITLALTGLVSWVLGGRLAEAYRREYVEKRRAEAAVDQLRQISAESEAQRRFLEGLIASAPVAIAVLEGPEYRYVSVNAHCRALRPEVEMLGRTFAEVFPEAVSQGARALLDEAFQTGKVLRTIDRPYDLDASSGRSRTRYFSSVISRYDGPDGRPAGLLLVSLETTDAVLVRQRAEREKDEFLSTASHELKTPLSALSLAAQMIERMRRRGPLDPNRLDRYVDTISVQAERASRLINDLLDVSQIRTGELRLQFERLDLATLVKTAVERHSDSLPEQTEHRIVLALPEESLMLEGDPARLDQVLTNLLSNATKYSPEGGRIDVSLSRGAAEAVLAVADRGVGIPEAERESIFSPFGRTTTARESGVEGTGLGLYITRRIVEAHGGSIGVHPTPGGGSTFTVTLPLSAQRSNEVELRESA